MARAPSDTLLTGAELSAFVAIVETGSLAAAADALDLTTSAVTKRLQTLEGHAGVRLLERGNFGARTTEAGRLLYPDARNAVNALQRVYNLIRQQGAELPMRLGASHTVGEFLLPVWIAGFRSRAGAALRVSADIVNSRRVRQMVAEGSVDVGFVEDSEDEPEGVDSLPLQRDEIVVVVAKGHCWAGLSSIPPEALLSMPYCTREHGSGTRSVAESTLSRIGVDLSPTLEVASTQSLKRALSGGGFALLSRIAVDVEVASGVLCASPLEGVVLERTLCAIRPAQRDLPPVAQRFWQWLGESVSSSGLSYSPPSAP